ncbi:tyrosine-type recombinase/integrase [Rhodococcus jostii]|uniref:tyrosine-type recombinase/integrase n=1 Tax=Rhodococcus jostii TaxID=132919 RepID=UPI00363FFF5D
MTVRNFAGQLTGALAMAVEDGHVLRVPKIVAPKSDSKHVMRSELLTADQVWQLAEDAREGRKRIKGVRAARRGDDRYARMILIAAGTGLRSGELCGLRISSVDFLRREVHVLEQADGGSDFGWARLKTSASRRVVPVGQTVIDLLAEELTTNPCGDRSLPIFRTARGQMWSPTTVANRFSALRRDCDLPEGRSFHDLRHFYASTLIFAGASVPMVAQYLGHASAAVTLDVYAHLWPGDDDRARDAVDSVLMRDQCGTGLHAGPVLTSE